RGSLSKCAIRPAGGTCDPDHMRGRGFADCYRLCYARYAAGWLSHTRIDRGTEMAVKETEASAPVKLGSVEFGEWLAGKREAAGLTRYELAEKVGISYPYV